MFLENNLKYMIPHDRYSENCIIEHLLKYSNESERRGVSWNQYFPSAWVAIYVYFSDVNQYIHLKREFYSWSLFKTAFQDGFFYNFYENPCFTISIDIYILNPTRFSSTSFIQNVFDTTDKTLYVINQSLRYLIKQWEKLVWMSMERSSDSMILDMSLLIL